MLAWGVVLTAFEACSPRVEVARPGAEAGVGAGAEAGAEGGAAGQGNTVIVPQGGDGGAPLNLAGQGGMVGAGEDCPCVPALRWQTSSSESSHNLPDSNLLTCGGYQRFRETVEQCSTTLACDGLTGAVARAVADPDVQAALAAAPIFYGSDPRPTGTVLQLNIDGKGIEIGAGCGGFAACIEPPAGITALAGLLAQVEARELTQPTCLERCPDRPLLERIGEPCPKYGLRCEGDSSGCVITCKNGLWVSADIDCTVGGGGGPG
jgi:hypothetical protein